MVPDTIRAAGLVVIWMAAMCLPVGGWCAQPLAAPQAGIAAAQAPAHASGQASEQRVVAIRIVTETGEVLEENPVKLALQPGQPFDSEAARESLRQLYRTGRYADLRAETSRVADGVRLDFVVRQNFYVNVVRVAGLREPPSEALALASMRLGLGETFRQSALDEALERLRQTLREDGFYQAQIEHELVPHPDTRQMDILVRVAPGPRSRLAAIELRNHTEFPDRELLARSRLKSGREVTAARLNRAVERLRKFLADKDHLGARATLARGDYDPQTGRLPVRLELNAGPRVRVEVTGAKFRSRDLRKLLPIYQEGAVDEDLLQEGRRAIRDALERDGYFDAQVRYTTRSAESEQRGRKAAAAGRPGAQPASAAATRENLPEDVITYQVERGPQHRLLGVVFTGNHYFGDELLRSRLRIQPAEFASRGRFSRGMVEEDGTSIRELYAANGFQQAQVRTEVLDDYQGKVGNVFVRFHIEEGSQTRVAALKLEGNHAFNDNELLAVIGSTAGEPYSDFGVASDRDNILALYYNEGFPQARFTSSVEEAPATAQSPVSPPAGSSASPPAPTSEAKGVRLTYHIAEGPQINVARVLVGGYQHTRRNVVEREVQVKAGGPLREGEVVETQRRLYNLGVFNRVAIAPQNPTGTDPSKTLVVLVDEAKRYTLGYGFGFEVQRLGGAGTSPVGGQLSASPRGLFEIAKANLTGRADTLSFKGRASTFQGRGLLSYSHPRFLGRSAFTLLLTGLADKTRDVRTFTSTRYEGSLQISQRVSPITSLLYRYSFRRVLVDPSSLRIAPDQVPLFSQPTKISLVGLTWLRERRDNPADAARGDFNSVDFSIAAKPIGSSASFARLVAQNSTFHPIRRRFVFARSFQFGLQKTLGSTVATDIPLPERFFAGGGNSLRGFSLNQAGPRDPTTGFPIGGLTLLVFNQELRFPMRLPWVGNRLGGALLYDAGNVFNRLGGITLRTAPSAFNSATGNLNYFSHTIGFGFRYGTPIGPVRLDLAYQLNPALFTFVDSTGLTQRARLPAFQFFFSLGSVF